MMAHDGVIRAHAL